MNRAYSVLTIKAVDEDTREIRGTATTPTPDSYGDVIEPKGAEFKLPMPLLWQHDSSQPIGHVIKAIVTASGIEITAKLVKTTEPGKLRERLDEAWQSIKLGLVRGFSIGFRSLEHSFNKETGGIHFLRWAWLETSAVTIPAQSEATISSIKSFDLKHLPPASGPPQVPIPPGVSGTPKQPASGGFFYARGKSMRSANEIRGVIDTTAARLNELAAIFKQDGYEPTEDENSEFDNLTLNLKQLKKDCRLQELAEMTAKPVIAKDARSGSESRGGMSFVRKADLDDKFKGQSYTRCLIAKALAMVHGPGYAVDTAQKRWGTTNPKLVEVIRAAVAGGGTGSGEWGAELAQLDARYAGDFVEFLYSRTVFDQLGLREVPGRVRIKGQDGAFTGYWVGESKAIPMSKGDYSSVDLTPLKVAALTVISMELMEDSQPSAEMVVRDGLVQAASQRVDTTFLSDSAAVSGVSPAGILNGVTALTTAGTDLDAVRADLQALISIYTAAKMGSGITLVMSPSTALAISFMYGALDQRAFPDINQNGGSINGIPVVVGDNVDAGNIIAIRTQDVWRIGDSGVQISMSREATIEQQDDPTGATDTPVGVTTTNLTNMFQEESIAFKVVRRINFQKRRSNAVQWINNVEYGGVIS